MPPTYVEPIRFQCRHIFTDGHRCGAACLRGEEFCYYHHTTRLPVPNREIKARKSRREVFNIPNPEDRSAIQHSIGEVLRRIASNDIDPRRAGLLLYGLQIASLNLPKHLPTREPASTVEEIIIDPVLGPLAIPCKVGEAEEEMGPTAKLLRELGLDDDYNNSILPKLQAEASPQQNHRSLHRRPRRKGNNLLASSARRGKAM